MLRSTRKSNLRWAILISLLLNHALIIPGLFTLIAQKWATPDSSSDPPVEVELVDDPTPQVDSPPVEPPRTLAQKRKKKLALAPLEPKPAERPPDPLKPPLPQPVPDPKKPLPPPPPELTRLKMVEVQNPESDTAPPDARFLSDKNRRVIKETRARDTNLLKDHARPQPLTKPNPLKSPQRGARQDKIAETHQVKAQLAKARPLPKKSPLMTMRAEVQPNPRQVPREMLAKPAEDGTLAPMQKEQLAQRSVERRPQLDLDYRSLDRIDGQEAAKARELARLSPSTPKGHYDQKWTQIRSALENFIPEVQPGNQTALGTRADPFALYIARMHRGIHRLWGFGFLVDLDRKPDGNPMNNMQLWTMVEIVVNPNGSVDKATIVHHSGLLPFDVAALDTVYTANPYPPTPRDIRSADGKVYLHWRFHRNQRQCGTFGVDPYILTTPPHGPIDGNKAEVGRTPRRLRSLNHQPTYYHTPSGHKEHAEGAGHEEYVRGAGHKEHVRGAGHKEHVRGAGHKEHAEGTDPRERSSSSRHDKARELQQARLAAKKYVSPRDPKALAAVQTFLRGFRQANPGLMSQVCGLPFLAQGSSIASRLSDLKRMLGDLIEEEPSRTTAPPRMMSLLEARTELSHLPAGADYSKEMLICLTQLGKTSVTLILQRKDSTWQVIGINR